MELEGLNVDEGFEPDFVSVFRKQKVAGCILVDLDDAEMEDIGIEAWGDRRRLRKLISSGVAKQSPTVTPRRYEVVGSTVIFETQAHWNLHFFPETSGLYIPSLAWPDPIPHRGKGSGTWP